MEQIVGFSESESFLVPESAPVRTLRVKPRPQEPEVSNSPRIDRFAESKIASHTPESAQRMTRVSPVFELASVGHGRAQDLTFSQQDGLLSAGNLKSNIDGALALIVSRLEEGESLITTHAFHPQSSGCMEVSTRFHVERELLAKSARLQNTQMNQWNDVLTDWRGVFRTGLALLNDDYSFRQLDIEGEMPSTHREFLQFDSCTMAGQTSIGFTASGSDTNVPVSLPLWSSINGSSLWPGALVNTIKAARAQELALTVGVKISRVVLNSDQRGQLEKLDVKSDLQGRHHSSALSKVIRSLVDHAGEFLRIEPFAEVDSDPTLQGKLASWPSKRAAALVDVFAKEVLPLHTGGRIGGANGVLRHLSGASTDSLLDLTTVMPYSGSLPPLLAKPQVLRELDFPRHHGNHAIRMPLDGLLLGTAQVGGFEQVVRLRQADRSRHVYMVGGTGTGKTALIRGMMKQDLDEGRGFALSDPGGDLFEQMLGCIPSQRIDDVVIIDPSDSSMAVGLNPLDLGDTPSPQAVNRLIGDLLDIFNQLYDMQASGGPGFEQYFRNTFLAASTAPYESPSNQQGRPSFATVLAILRDADFRDYVLSKVKQSFLGEDMGGEVVDFFATARATSGDQSFANWIPYVSNKLTRFTSNPLMRQLLCSGARTIDFRKIMDEKKILLVNLSKGAIGSLDASLIGMLVSKGLFGAAISRFDAPKEHRVPFTYYCDEFQNFVTPDIGTVLAEGRKWGLQAVLAHQTLGQLRTGTSRAVLDAILGNIPTQLVFRTGIEEAAILEQAMQPQIDKLMLTQLPDRQVAARMLIDNKVSTPFIFRTATVVEQSSSQTEQARITALARESSREKYGIARGKSRASISPTPGTPASDVEGATPGAIDTSPPHLLMKGLVKVRGHLQPVETAKLDARIQTALETWKCAASRERDAGLKPQTGHLYQTVNQSLVFVTSENGAGSAKAVVLAGGHKDGTQRGEKPGETVDLTSLGKLHCSSPAGPLLGMSLSAEMPVPLVTEHWSRPQRSCAFDWLLAQEVEQQSQMTQVVGGFHLTLNGSMVHVISAQDAEGEHRAIVLSGGHGVSSLMGETVAETFRVDSQGRYCLSGKLVSDATPIKLAAASGMSLHYRVDTPALDSPAPPEGPDVRAVDNAAAPPADASER